MSLFDTNANAQLASQFYGKWAFSGEVQEKDGSNRNVKFIYEFNKDNTVTFIGYTYIGEVKKTVYKGNAEVLSSNKLKVKYAHMYIDEEDFSEELKSKNDYNEIITFTDWKKGKIKLNLEYNPEGVFNPDFSKSEYILSKIK